MLSQHAVVAEPEPESPRATGVATAKMERARTEKAARRENILVKSEVCEVQKTLGGCLLGINEACSRPFIRLVALASLPGMCRRTSSGSWLGSVSPGSTVRRAEAVVQ